jgi:hypothetical protein
MWNPYIVDSIFVPRFKQNAEESGPAATHACCGLLKVILQLHPKREAARDIRPGQNGSDKLLLPKVPYI